MHQGEVGSLSVQTLSLETANSKMMIYRVVNEGPLETTLLDFSRATFGTAFIKFAKGKLDSVTVCIMLEKGVSNG